MARALVLSRRTDGQPTEVAELGQENVLADFHADLLGPVLECNFLIMGQTLAPPRPPGRRP